MAQAATKPQKNRKLFERRDMKTERSFFWIWTDWLVDKAPFHQDTPTWRQLQSLEISSLSSSKHNPSFRLCEEHQKPWALKTVIHRRQFYSWSWKSLMEIQNLCLCKFKSSNLPRTFTHTHKDTAQVLHWSVTPPLWVRFMLLLLSLSHESTMSLSLCYQHSQALWKYKETLVLTVFSCINV